MMVSLKEDSAMKKCALVLVSALLVLSACSTVSSMVPGVSLPSVPGVAPLAGMVDLRDGEVLCAMGANPYELDFHNARIVTPPSAATRNQAEVVFVSDGRKEWVNHVIPSRKAVKADMAVGKVLFVPHWSKMDKNVSSDDYRKTPWELARVTSTEELFKDVVEVGGVKYLIQNVRAPLQEP